MKQIQSQHNADTYAHKIDDSIEPKEKGIQRTKQPRGIVSNTSRCTLDNVHHGGRHF
jgi:hypothetical protein